MKRVAEIVRLHVDHRDAVEAGELLGRDDLHVDVEQVRPSAGFPGRVAPCSAAMTAGLLGAAQHVAQRQAARHRVGIGVVVQENQDAVGIAEEALVLLDLETRQRSAELDEQRRAEQLGDREVVHLRERSCAAPLRACVASPRRRRARTPAWRPRRESLRGSCGGCACPCLRR